MRRQSIRSTSAALLATAIVVTNTREVQAHAQIPVLIQVTRNTVGEIHSPRIRSQAGDSIVFVSDGDVLGPGTSPGHREVYIYRTGSGAITRITNTIDGESYDAARETDDVNTRRDLFVAFISTGNLDASGSNADHNPEVFLWFEETGEFIQVTITVAPVVNAEAYASDSGKCLTFRSTGDVADNDGSDPGNPGLNFHNADGSAEIFNVSFGDSDFSRSGWVFTQVSNGPAGTTSSHPVIGGYWYTRQCRSTAYQSDHDQLANGSSGMHIYNYTRSDAVLEQLSAPGAGNHFNPGMSSASQFARGPFVVYQSDGDLLGNGSDVSEIYRFRLFKDELRQYTFAAGDSTRPAISDGGGRLVMESKGELFRPDTPVRSGALPPFNSDGNSEIFVTKGTRQITQITQSENCENNYPSLRDTGDAVAFRSTCNLIANLNPDGVPQVFYYVQVERDDPLSTAEGCSVVDGCCNVANGCYEHLVGAKQAPPRGVIRPGYAD